jgi:hypothetical protein
MCNNCGNVGYTIEINDEGEEFIESCFECFVEAHELDYSFTMADKNAERAREFEIECLEEEAA